MNKYIHDKTELYNTIYEGQYQVIAVCITPWHLLGIRAFLRWVEDNVCLESALIIIQPHPSSGYCVTEDCIENIKTDDRVTIIYSDVAINNLRSDTIFDFLRCFKHRRKETTQAYLVSASLPLCFLECKLLSNCGIKHHLVLVDEGVSGYLSALGWYFHTMREVNSKKASFRIYLRHVFAKIVNIILMLRLLDFRLYKKKNGVAYKNDWALEYYSQFIKTSPREQVLINYAYVIILTQPQGETDDVSNIQRVYNEVFQIFREKRISVFVKPHPRDNSIQWYIDQGCIIIKDAAAIETYYSCLTNKPIAVIGINSTALVTLHTFFNVRSISIIHLLGLHRRKWINFNDNAFFVRFFSRFVEFPTKIDALRLLVEELDDQIK